uniref:Uncharacterized protein n=1 Tax=viral metagenome TaxID=1070528 RepID=A0A6C0BL98_9ZZZZ
MKWSEEYLKTIQDDKKCKVLDTVHGSRAVSIMKEVFDTPKEWMAQLSPYEKRNALLIVYSIKKIKNKVIIFQIVVGNKETGSVLGERFAYEKGIELIAKLI